MQECRRKSLASLQPIRGFVFQQDNDLKQAAEATQRWFKDSKVNVVKWPSHSRDLIVTENLWLDLERAVHS